MLKKSISCCTIALCLAVSAVFAVENEKDVDWDKIAKIDGVTRVKTENGVVKSFVVVSSSRISHVLGAAKGKKTAQKRAVLQAKAEIVKWIKSKVKVYESSTDETISILMGDGKNISETGKSHEVSSSKIEEVAEGIVRGTSIIYSNIRTIGNDQEYVIILGWSAKNVQTAEKVHDIMNSKNVNPKATATEATKEKKTTRLPEERIISDEASEY